MEKQHINNQVNEYFCNTCKFNEKLERVINYEMSHKNTYIPPRIRTTKKVGLVFTKASIMYNWHIAHGSHHDWGNVDVEQNIIEALKA
jgi:hypothetical protein